MADEIAKSLVARCLRRGGQNYSAWRSGQQLIVELDFEVVRAQWVVVYGSYFAAIDATIAEPWPPLVWDVQVETYQCLRPFRVDGEVRNDGARHREQNGL